MKQIKLTRMLLGSSLLLLLPGVLTVEGLKSDDANPNLLRRRDDASALLEDTIRQPSTSSVVDGSRGLQYYGQQVRVNLSAATEPLDWVETRSTYVLYPEAAKQLLREELQIIDAAIGLDVTTSMTHPEIHYQVWSLLKGIVHRFRKQNQIIHANPHYFISSGVEVNCREKIIDPDTNQEHEIEIMPVPGHCRFHCTNHGRYCVMPPADSDKDGIEIIEETLRRICFAKIYHASDLRFWEYMEALRDEACVTGHTDCSHKALQQIRLTSQHAIDNCMHLAGGTADDTPNVHLQLEVDHRTDPHQHSHSFTLEELPMITVGGHKFTGDVWSAETIFPFVCQVFHQQTGTLPLACEFCDGCQDVRKCLWKLECDGQLFQVDGLTNYANPPHDPLPSSPATPTEPVEPVVVATATTPTEPVEPVATTTATTTSAPPDVEVVPHYDENSAPAAGTEEEEQEEEETPSLSSSSAASLNNAEDATATTTSEEKEEEEEEEEEEDGDSTPSSSPTAAPTAFDKYAERKKQQEEMDHIYVRWLLSFVAIGVCVLVYLFIREHRRRRRENITEQFKEGTQARWMSRGGDMDDNNMMDASNTDYSGGMSWPQRGGAAAAAMSKNTRISRKNRSNKNKQSVHDQRMNQDHSSTGAAAGGGMRTRFLDGLGLGGFGRNTTMENTPGLGFARQSSLENQRVIMDMYNHRTLQPGGGNNGGPAFTRHLSLEQTGARRRSAGDTASSKTRTTRRGSRSWGEALEQHHSDHERGSGGGGGDNSGNRFTAAHTAALMEAAATATPVPAQPLTSVSRSRTVPAALEARRRLQTPLEPIFSSSDEDNSGSSESNESGGDNLTQVSERSRGSGGGGDQLSYSTNWLTGYQDDRAASGGGQVNDASAMFEGLEDVTTL